MSSEIGSKVSENRDASESEWETDEEELVHVELSGIFQDDILRKPEVITKCVGLDSQEPIVQLGNQVFAGKYTEVVGTSVFFQVEDVTEEDEVDPVFGKPSDQKLNYLCKSGKKLVLKRVFLNKKQTSKPAATETPSGEEKDSNDK